MLEPLLHRAAGFIYTLLLRGRHEFSRSRCGARAELVMFCVIPDGDGAENRSAEENAGKGRAGGGVVVGERAGAELDEGKIGGGGGAVWKGAEVREVWSAPEEVG